MDQFDVCKLKKGDVVVVLQHGTYAAFRTRVVAPLVPRSRGKLSTNLNPIIKHGGREWVMATHLMSVVGLAALSEPLGSVADQEYPIKRAVDQLFLGI